MEFNKTDKLLDGETDVNVPRFITQKWVEVHDQSNNDSGVSKPIRFKNPMLRSDLCDYSEAYVWVRGIATQVDANHNDNYDRRLNFKNNAPFSSCISKINGKLVENAEDLDVVMPVYNLLEYSKNYQKTSGSMFNYYRDEPNEASGPPLVNPVNISIRFSKSFDYKTKITGSFATGNNEKEVTIAIPLKHLGNFWRNLDIPLINCEISLNLIWYNKCALVGRGYTAAAAAAAAGPPAVAGVESPTNETFRVASCKLYVPVVTLSAKNDNKLLEKLKSGFTKTIKWNKYMSKISTQARNDNLNYLIDPTFRNVNMYYLLKMKMIEHPTINIMYQM